MYKLKENYKKEIAPFRVTVTSRSEPFGFPGLVRFPSVFSRCGPVTLGTSGAYQGFSEFSGHYGLSVTSVHLASR